MPLLRLHLNCFRHAPDLTTLWIWQVPQMIKVSCDESEPNTQRNEIGWTRSVSFSIHINVQIIRSFFTVEKTHHPSDHNRITTLCSWGHQLNQIQGKASRATFVLLRALSVDMCRGEEQKRIERDSRMISSAIHKLLPACSFISWPIDGPFPPNLLVPAAFSLCGSATLEGHVASTQLIQQVISWHEPLIILLGGFNLSQHYESTKVRWDPKWDWKWLIRRSSILVLSCVWSCLAFFAHDCICQCLARTVLQTIPGWHAPTQVEVPSA